MITRTVQIAPSESTVAAIGPATVTVIPHSAGIVWASSGSVEIAGSALLQAAGQPYSFNLGEGDKLVLWCDGQHRVDLPEDRIVAAVSIVVG